VSIAGTKAYFDKNKTNYPLFYDKWQRPSEWIQLPDLTNDTQKIVALFAVYDNPSNFVTFRCTGAITVDWGDGTATENINSGVTAEHNYAYANAGNTTTEGWRQVIITITPQSGQNITAFNIRDFRHSAASAVSSCYNWLQLRLKTPSLTSIVLQGGGNVDTDTIQSIEVLESALTSLLNAFAGIVGLQRVYVKSSATVTNMQGCFSSGNANLIDIVCDITIGANTSFNTTFSGCQQLRYPPKFKFASNASINSIQYCYANCFSLLEAPDLGNLTSACTDFIGVFSGCRSLRRAPNMNTNSAATTTEMFDGCYSLISLPLYNTQNVTNMSFMFRNCTSLRSVPAFNTRWVTTYSNMFLSCNNLTSMPHPWGSTSATIMTAMFRNCFSLKNVAAMTSTNVTSFIDLFRDCTALTAVPALSMGSATAASGYSSMFLNCFNVGEINATGIKFTFTVANCQLSGGELDNIYANLPTVVGQSLTVTGNYGTATDNTGTATAKGWQVIG
jgi:hypothetical protein